MKLATRWRELRESERKPYLDRHAAELQRFRQESHDADVAALAVVEARRAAALNVEDSRGARAVMDQERVKREERRLQKQRASAEDDSEEANRRREIAAQKKAEVKERREKREAEENLLAKQHKKLDKEEARKASARLDYLLKQSSIFAKLQGGKGGLPTGADDQAASKQIDKKKPPAKRDGVHHIHRPDSAAEDDEVEEEEEIDRHVFLTKQPSSIKSGQLKAYQLEALNWMIHLAEKGLNGILADGVYLKRRHVKRMMFTECKISHSSLAYLILHYSFPLEMGLGKYGF